MFPSEAEKCDGYRLIAGWFNRKAEKFINSISH